MDSQQPNPPVTFPIPPDQPRKFDYTVRTLGEFRAMTLRLPADVLLIGDFSEEYGIRIAYFEGTGADDPPSIMFLAL